MLPLLRSSGGDATTLSSIHQGGLRVGGGSTGMDMLMEFINGGGGGGGGGGGEFKNTLPPAAGSQVATRVAKSHSEAERRRRQRINGHLATLRTLLPNTSKENDTCFSDGQGFLLTEVVRHVRELRRCADDVAEKWPDTWKGLVPGETDEVKIDRVGPAENGDPEHLVSVSICCEDRPGLMTEVNQAIRAVQARAVRAEMATIGGRTKSVVIMKGEVEGEERSVLHATLRAVMQKPGSAGKGLLENNNKRLRFTRPVRMT